MAKSGLKHIDVGAELTKTEWESEESHELIHGTSFPSSPVERQLFYRDDEHKWYIYNGTTWVWLGGGGGMEVHDNEYHNPDFADVSHTHSDLSPAHKDVATGVHGVGAGTIAKVGDIAVDSNLSAAAQDAITKRHTQNTDTRIHDADSDTQIHVEKSANEDKIRMDVKGVEAFLLNDAGVLTFAKQSGCHAYLNAASQTIPNSTPTKINLDTAYWDIQSEFDAANKRIVVKTAGLYFIYGSTRWSTPVADKTYDVRILKNGALIALGQMQIPYASYQSVSVVSIAFLSANDYLELWTQQTSGADDDLDGGTVYRTCLVVAKIA